MQRLVLGLHAFAFRLKRCFLEIFAFYSKAPVAAVLRQQQQQQQQQQQCIEGLPIGLTFVAFRRLCFDLRLQPNLLSDYTQV